MTLYHEGIIEGIKQGEIKGFNNGLDAVIKMLKDSKTDDPKLVFAITQLRKDEKK